jgi:Aldo/keto reductase family
MEVLETGWASNADILIIGAGLAGDPRRGPTRHRDLNARGFSVFGLEVSYFAGEAEALVPRVVVRPSLGRPFHAVIDPIAEKYDATPQQIALAWQLHRTAQALPIPGTTSVQHLKENLAAAHISLTPDEVDAITALAPEEN